MKGGGKKKSTLSEALNDAVDAAVADAAFDVNGSHGNGGDPPAPFVENDHTQLQIGEGEETHLQDLEGEGAEAEEDDAAAAEREKGDGDRVPEQGPGPILDGGFYEVEEIRQRRVRKGQLQYFIKWRGWPETANTWEPLENLDSIPEMVDAFEESLKSGKHSKRKRKHVVHHTHPKKRQQRSNSSYSLRRFATSIDDNHTQSAPLNDLSPADFPAFPQTVLFVDEEENNGDACSLGKGKHVNENGFATASKRSRERNEENDYDPKLSELRATTTNGVHADKLAIHFQQAKASTGNGHMDGQSKVDCMEPVQSGRCRGAKRRKSGSVKRFNKESHAGRPFDTERPISMSVGTLELARTGIPDSVGNNSQKKMDHAKPACNVVKIVKPIGYSASLSSNIQDVLVTFMAMKSDGTEVMVDNKYLKAYNPILLINFYEQHLRYSPTPTS